MQWSPERVLDFGPSTHLPWVESVDRFLLWPFRTWRVVTPIVGTSSINALQRALLRLHKSGAHDETKIGALLGLDPGLIRFVVDELKQRKLLTYTGMVTRHGDSALRSDTQSHDDMRVGWVFQDTHTGRLLPRFVTSLTFADADANEQGWPILNLGTKGRPRKVKPFVIDTGHSEWQGPQPLAILRAAQRHRRHERQVERAELELDYFPTESIRQVALIDDHPEVVHLLTFTYAPHDDAYGDDWWYVADPFGFGASAELRERLEAIRDQAHGRLREEYDRITGQQHRAVWFEIREMVRNDARTVVEEIWPAPLGIAHEQVRDECISAFASITYLEQDASHRSRKQHVESFYLKLRLSLASAIRVALGAHAPSEAWRNIGMLPHDALMRVVETCIGSVGFQAPVPKALLRVEPTRVKQVYARLEATSDLRALCVALILSSAGEPKHSLRRVAAVAPDWIADFDTLADPARGALHNTPGPPALERIREDAYNTIHLCRTLLDALGVDGHADASTLSAPGAA